MRKNIFILLCIISMASACGEKILEEPETFTGTLSFKIPPQTRLSFGEDDRLGGDLIWRHEYWATYEPSSLYLYSPSENEGRAIRMIYNEDGYFRSANEITLSAGTKHFSLVNYPELDYADISYPTLNSICLDKSQDEQYFHWSRHAFLWLDGGVDIEVSGDQAVASLNGSSMSHALSYIGFKLKTSGRHEGQDISQIKVSTLSADEYLTGLFNINMESGAYSFIAPVDQYEAESNNQIVIMNSAYRASRDITVNTNDPVISHIGVIKPGTVHGIKVSIVLYNWGGQILTLQNHDTFTFEPQTYKLFTINLDNMTIE